MYTEAAEYEVVIQLQQELTWADIAPVVDELQNRGVIQARVERWNMRVAAGGPGYDIVPIGVILFFGALMQEVVRDVVYPYLKDKLLALYRKVCASERAVELKPLAIALREGELKALYRFPAGLGDAEFASALGEVVSHFETTKGMTTMIMVGADEIRTFEADKGVVVFDFNSASGIWELREDASAFMTFIDQRASQEAAEPDEPTT